MKNKITGICPLCDKRKELVQSHTIPEGFHKKIYDEYGRAIYASKSRDISNHIQKGKREYLLCENCDNGIIGKYDKYAIEVIRDRKHIRERIENNHYYWNEINYEKFKLFHLSILWRLHISKEISKGVNLAIEDANMIRDYILSGTAPDSFSFPVFGFYLIDPNDNNICDEIITFGNPYLRDNEEGSIVYTVFFGGICWNYLMVCKGEDDPLKDLFLGKSNEFKLPIQDIRIFKPFLDIYESVRMAASFTSERV